MEEINQATIIMKLPLNKGKIRYTEENMDYGTNPYRWNTYKGKVNMFITKGKEKHIGEGKTFKNNLGELTVQKWEHPDKDKPKIESFNRAMLTMCKLPKNADNLNIGVVRVQVNSSVVDIKYGESFTFKKEEDGKVVVVKISDSEF